MTNKSKFQVCSGLLLSAFSFLFALWFNYYPFKIAVKSSPICRCDFDNETITFLFTMSYLCFLNSFFFKSMSSPPLCCELSLPKLQVSVEREKRITSCFHHSYVYVLSKHLATIYADSHAHTLEILKIH